MGRVAGMTDKSSYGPQSLYPSIDGSREDSPGRGAAAFAGRAAPGRPAAAGARDGTPRGGALAGLAGTLTITVENKQHFYGFDYTLPAE